MNFNVTTFLSGKWNLKSFKFTKLKLFLQQNENEFKMINNFFTFLFQFLVSVWRMFFLKKSLNVSKNLLRNPEPLPLLNLFSMSPKQMMPTTSKCPNPPLLVKATSSSLQPRGSKRLLIGKQCCQLFNVSVNTNWWKWFCLFS